jgi:O-antigen/teichoic acid export membrane protein
MSRVRVNIAANIVGQAWQVMLAVACTPLYIKLLGIEAFGLIAFYMLVQSITQLLDLGLSATVNREIARLSGNDDATARKSLGRIVGTIERWYFLLGAMIAVVLCFAIPDLAIWWLRPENLHSSEIIESARIFGLFALLQWPIMFYQNGLSGLQRQFTINAIQIPFGAISSIGGLLFIWLGPRSVSALFAWQAGSMFLQLLVLYCSFWRHLGISRSDARTDTSVLKELWRFSLGMSGISIAGLIVTHLDKVILSRFLSLESFGIYSLAGTLAKGLYVLITPIFNAYFPRFSALVSSGDPVAIRTSYHSAAQVMAVLSVPLAAVVTLFSGEIAFAWLHNAKIATEVAPVTSLLVIGNCLNGLMSISFALQLAHGRTRISLYTNSFLVIVLVPAIIAATLAYGVIGAAATWAFTNALYILVGVPITHKYLLKGEALQWLTMDILPPLVVSIAVVGLGRAMISATDSIVLNLAIIGLLWMVATAAAAVSAAHVRATVYALTRTVLKK